METTSIRRGVALVALTWSVAAGAYAQTHDNAEKTSAHEMDMMPPGWRFGEDGQVLAMFNHQGGPAGGDEVKAPNWWMGTLTRKLGSSRLTLDTMFSLDAATVGARGYRELFQQGEAF